MEMIQSQLTSIDTNVRCLALADGSKLALQAMLDRDCLQDFPRLKSMTMQEENESKILLKGQGSLQIHLVPVPHQPYQLILVNNIHEVAVYKDFYGASAPQFSEGLQGSLKLLARISISHMSSCLVVNDRLVMGQNLPRGKLFLYNLITFEEEHSSTSLLPEKVTCMCEDDS